MSKQNATNKLQVSEKTCEFCKKQFTTKRNCLNHLNICKIKKEDEYSKNLNDIQILKLKYQSLTSEYTCLKNENISLKTEVENLKNIIEKQHPKNTFNQINNPNIIINTATSPSLKDLIANLEPIDFNEMKSSFENDLTNKYIDKGIEGIARFICDIPCQNKIVTTDYSRKVITYKTQEHIIVDPKGSILLNTALKQNADTIIDKTEDRYNYWKSQVKDAKDEEIEPNETDVENKKSTKKLLHITSKVKKNVSVSPIEATNIFVMKGIENKTSNAIEG